MADAESELDEHAIAHLGSVALVDEAKVVNVNYGDGDVLIVDR